MTDYYYCVCLSVLSVVRLAARLSTMIVSASVTVCLPVLSAPSVCV